MTGEFVHLHTHTHYSLLDGMSKVPELLDRAKELGMDSMAITDHGVMYGAIEFYKEAKKRDMKAIIGIETYVAPRKHTDKAARIDTSPYHLVLLAKNNVGYKNLMKLSSIAHLEGYYYKPRVDKELLKKYHEGIIALSSCFQGELIRNLSNKNFEGAVKAAKEYEEIFGKGNYYIELQDHPDWNESVEMNKELIKLSKETKIPMVVTRDSHYIRETDQEVHDILLCIQTGKTVGEIDRFKIESELWLTTPEETIKRFADVPEAVANTVKIAEMCNVEIELGKNHLPEFAVPAGETPSSLLRELCLGGLSKRYGRAVEGTNREEVLKTLPDELKNRLEYEVSVIEQMGFQSYFLIVQDFINWAKTRGIVVGPGRGSGAGSLVAYVLQITDIDPIKHNLLFERFLNPDRITMPDFDIDFQDDRRDEVIQYVTEKYGVDHVAHIITFGSIMARNAVRDTGRALGMSYVEVDEIAKMVKPPFRGVHIPLRESVSDVAELKAKYDTDSRMKKLLDLAMRLEGVFRHASTHAAGVVISKNPLTDYVPVQKPVRTSSVANQTQYSMKPIEEIGLLKMDFLGLANLTILNNALRVIKDTEGVEIDLNNIPLDDAKTFALLARGDTMGVFQLESDGMRKYLKDLKPTEFEDIVAMVSLYRPGPMQWLGDFIDRKHGRKEISYAHPLMEPALKNTYGIIVYQEQVMQISVDMCGFTGPQADTLRYAMGKKIQSLMLKMRESFIEGAVKKGVEKNTAEDIFKSLEDFSAYAFNKSHAACYALIAYETAYLKAHYPAQFMAALMTSEYNDIEKVALEVEECERMGIKVLPPDINESNADFWTVLNEDGTRSIRFGLKAVKNIGEGTINSLVAVRKEGGRFTSVDEIAKRIPSGDLNKKVMESLIKCGAMDEIGERGLLLANMEKILDYSNTLQKSISRGQMDIFGSSGDAGVPKLILDIAAPLDRKVKLAFERELLGLYISEHPLKPFSEFFASEATPINALSPTMEGREVKIGGIVSSVHKILTKKNDPMAFVKIEDLTASLEVIVFPRLYQEKEEMFLPGRILHISGKISTKDRMNQTTTEIKLLADKVKEITDEELAKFKPSDAKPGINSANNVTPAPTVIPAEAGISANQLKIVFSGNEATSFTSIKELLIQNSGEVPVFLSVLSKGIRQTIKIPIKVNLTSALVQKIENLLGKDTAIVS